jgi:hypothetical protein
LESGIYGESLLPDGKWLMEVKTSESIPMWMCRLLSEYRIYPISFSKYGREYKMTLQPQKPSYDRHIAWQSHPAYDYGESRMALAQ